VQLERLTKHGLDATEQLALRNSPFMKRGGKRCYGSRAKFIIEEGAAVGEEAAFISSADPATAASASSISSASFDFGLTSAPLAARRLKWTAP
jgi:hypothetical protein